MQIGVTCNKMIKVNREPNILSHNHNKYGNDIIFSYASNYIPAELNGKKSLKGQNFHSMLTALRYSKNRSVEEPRKQVPYITL